jgi:two-component system sensor histidine kinase AlgZ
LNHEGDQGKAARDFFIPDLCAPRSVLILFLLAELLVIVFVLLGTDVPRFDSRTLAEVSLFVQWNVLLCAGLLCTARGLMARLSLQLGVVLSFLIILLVTLASSLVARSVYPSTSLVEYPNWWLMRNLLVALVIGGIVLRYFYLQQQLREQEAAELNARLASLRARIRPHFLFNTMNSIASLIGSRPEEAELVVEDLSELFRASLEEGEQDATVADEIRLCELYLRIEQLRLGDRLEVVWDVDPQLAQQAMPSLILQPLVENAVYHGVARIAAGGKIDISVREQNRQLVVNISNPLPPPETPLGEGHRMALDNIQQRLAALYGERAQFEAGGRGPQYRVRLAYPIGGGLL